MSARRRFVALATLAFVSGLVWVSPVSPAGTAPASAVPLPITVPGDYSTIQAAINAAVPGDTIEVSAGTYDERLTVNMSLTLVAVDGPEQTTITGGNAGIPIISANIPGSSTFTLQGFRLSGGIASTNDYGGGILLSGPGNATIKGNVFYANQADLIGGAIFTTATGTVTIDGNRFESNTASIGGAIGVSQAPGTTLINNVFYNNGSGGGGSGVYWSVPPGNPASIRSNTFVDNYRYGQGTGGTAITVAGTLTGSVVRNNIVYANSSVAAVVCEGSNDASFAGNDFLNLGGAEVSGCTDPVGTSGNLSVDPVFRNPDWNDYHIRPDSPLVDAGTADAGVTTDIDGDTRSFDGDASGGAQIDIGADEATDSLLFTPDYVVFGSFGATEIGTHSDKTLTMTNVGGSTVSVTSAVLSGPIADQISTLADTCTGASLGVGESCHIDLRYSPVNATSTDAVLTVTSPGVGGTRDVILSGYGSDPVQYYANNWLDVPVGSTHNGFVTIENQSATQSVTVTSVAITGGAGAADYEITNNPCTAAPILPGTSCDVTVAFTPSVLGQRDVQITATGPLPLGTRPYSWYATGLAPATPVTFGTTYKAGPAYTWNSGNALGRTVKSTTQYLHQGYATDRIGSSWAKDTGGPYAGIYYTRSGSGSTWGTPKRISPTSIHAIRFGLAASGSRVYVAYVTQTRIYNFSNKAPRVLYVRTNTNHGSSSYWKTPVKLTSSTGRVDYPTIAASGYDVHVAWTDAVTGSVYVATSKDRGATWTKRKVGTTTHAFLEGRVGYPSVAVSGSTVAVAWISDGAGTLMTRISTDRGTTWRAADQVATGSSDELQTAVRSGRVAVTWTDNLGVHVRTWTSGGGWGDDYLAAAVDTYAMYSPSIALQGSSRIAISWAEETATANYVRLRYAESTSNGATWYQPVTLASTSNSARRANDWPSIVWPAAGTRYVSWNGWTNNTNSYRLYLRKGTGTPVGLASVARVMTPDAGIAPAGAMPLTESKVGWLPPR